MLGKAGAQYRTALDEENNDQKSGNIQGTLLPSGNNLELKNKLQNQSKFFFL